MRVISGTARGLKLLSPKDNSIRPTTDRIKESLFNILAPYLQDISFLDLFSGSGAIGIEALSRGAKNAVFIDSSNESYKIINQNLQKAKFLQKAIVYNEKCNTALKKLSALNSRFDIIFMDPPYNKDLTRQTLITILENDLLNNNSFIICEQHIKEQIPEVFGLYNYKTKNYKITKMTFFKKD